MTAKKNKSTPVIDDNAPARRVTGEVVAGPSSKLSAERIEKLSELIAGGNYLSVAAAAVGISYETLRTWMRRGEREPDGLYHTLFVTLCQAKAEGEAAMLAEIVSIAKQSRRWEALAWVMERSMPEKWGRSNRIELITRKTIEERAEDEGLDANAIEEMAIKLALEAGEEEDDGNEHKLQ